MDALQRWTLNGKMMICIRKLLNGRTSVLQLNVADSDGTENEQLIDDRR